MKVLIISDSHGRNGRMELAIEQESPLDLIIHLGDLEGSDDILEAIAPCPVEMVCGNNDFFSPYPKEKVLNVGGVKVFICHGHYYSVYWGTEKLAEAARARGCSVAMYGHTHMPLIECEGDLTIINPGSISQPRQPGRQPSYMVMTVDEHQKASFETYYMGR